MITRDRAVQKISRLADWFPASLKLQFGDELEAVLADRLSSAAKKGWLVLSAATLHEIIQLPGLHLRERAAGRKDIAVQTKFGNGLNQPREPVPWGWTLVGLAPFLFVLLSVLYGNLVELYLRETGGADALRSTLYNAGYTAALVLYIPVLVAGWVRGFPVWFYPYAVQFILLIAVSSEYDPYGTNIARLYRLLGSAISAERAAPGMVILGNLLWLSMFLIPLALVIGISLFLTRKDQKRPLQEGLQALTTDLTRLSFGIFAMAPLFIPVIWDDLPGPELFKLLPHLLLAGGVLVYLRARRLNTAVAGIIAGFVFSYGLTIAFDQVNWSGAQVAWKSSTSLAEVLSCVFPFVLFILGPWMIHRYNHRRVEKSLN